MKNFSWRMLFVLILAMASLETGYATNPSNKKIETTTAKAPPPEVQKLLDRVYEIKNMDRTQLTTAQRKELKNELRDVKKELRAVESIYIPVTTVIIILLLLLILL